ncbi:MAG TPA: cation diffusion facilitator family transporter [Kofleriaceae bacterium]|nr:cation diffusion facilitator family transporter [Kofleriaceae bacterium]
MAEKPIAVYGALSANLIIAVAKLGAAAISGSAALFAEGIHSLVDTGNQVLLLVGIKRSRKPPGPVHPFGRGKEIYFWTLIVAVLLFGVGGGISAYEGVHALTHPSGERGDLLWAYIVLGIAFVTESVSWAIALRLLLRERGETFWKKLHHSKDPAKFVVFAEDTAAILGVVVAFLGVFIGHWLGSPVPDAVASIVIGAILAGVAIYLMSESRHLLIGEAADRDQVRTIVAVTEADPLVERAGQPLTMYFGPHELLINLEVKFVKGPSVREIAGAIERIESRLRENYPEVRRVFIEARL